MKYLFTLMLLLAGAGCRQENPTYVSSQGNDTASPSWVNRVWIRTDSTGLPGVMRIFLEDGTLIMDSCWETYRLARWQVANGDTVTWQEDTATIEAMLEMPVPDELRMHLFLGGDTLVENYRTADVPYVCPDMVR
jgi:hypothetical protein